jgi:hypothetical protein
MNVTDPLLDTLAVSTERAKSEFLRNSYTANEVSFIIDKSDLALNDEIIIEGTVYLVKGISININSLRSLCNVTARRYD